MSELEECRRKADELLRKATRTEDLNERSRLITEATHWHMKSLAAADPAQVALGQPKASE